VKGRLYHAKVLVAVHAIMGEGHESMIDEPAKIMEKGIKKEKKSKDGLL